MENNANNAKYLNTLAKKKVRDENGLFFVEGNRFVCEIPNNVKIAFYVVVESFEKRNPSFPFKKNIEKILLSERRFNKLSDTMSPQGVIAVCEKTQYNLGRVLDLPGNGPVLILEGIKDPGNFGTIIRTADASGAKAILTTDNTVDLYNPKVLRSTMGSVFNIPVIQDLSVDAITSELRKRNFSIFGASLNADAFYYSADFLKKTAVVIGSEADGISEGTEKICDELLKIPIVGKAESLNAGVAAAIIMYEILRQRKIG